MGRKLQKQKEQKKPNSQKRISKSSNINKNSILQKLSEYDSDQHLTQVQLEEWSRQSFTTPQIAMLDLHELYMIESQSLFDQLLADQ